MKRWDVIVSLGLVGAVGVGILIALGAVGAVSACNSGTGDCPDKIAIVEGASCSDEHLQCAYDLMTPAVACDGTHTVIATSCTCTDGTWSCPSAVECDSGASADDGGVEASDTEAGESPDAADAGDSSDAAEIGDVVEAG